MTDTRSGPADAHLVDLAVPPGRRAVTGADAACTGAVLRRLLRDVLPPDARVLAVGPHAADVIALVAGLAAHTTVLVGDAEQARGLAVVYPAGVDVRVGAIGGGAGPVAFDAVLALDGLDHVPGLDGPEPWIDRLHLLTAYATGAPQHGLPADRREPDGDRPPPPDGAVPDSAEAAGAVMPRAKPVLVVGCLNAFSLVGLLDARPPGQRPVGRGAPRAARDGLAPPGSPAALAAALDAAGVVPGTLYAAFGPDGMPHTLLDTALTVDADGFAARAAVRGMEAAARGLPLVSPIGGAAGAAADAGLLAALPERWLAVSGARGRPLYTRGGGDLVVAAEPEPDGWRLTPVADPPAPGRAVPDPDPSPLRASAAAVPERIPEGETVERQLRRQAATGDVAAVRVLAAELGAWLRAYHVDRPDALVCLDDLVPDGPDLVPGVLGQVWGEPVGSGEVLAAAWHRWHERLAAAGGGHPWPPWMSADDLVAVWLDAAGEPPAPEVLAQGRRIAAALRDAEGPPVAPADLRTALAAAASAGEHTAQLSAHIAGLTRSLQLRDEQLRVREERIRAQRAELRRIRGSRSFRLVRLLQRPRQLARALARRLHLR
ncbi:hypothetical protein [Catellatospora sp. IY07-71]|uniref:hypothetical protein n=1 Tax=Catellatospora sp. IY07-71 TaxID=2728827 RepID=UPI001BB438A2|nr:hypothetical protein [Catellatospora sp. IY07-71]